MGYVLTEEQQFLSDAAKDLLKSAPVSMVRELRDDKASDGYVPGIWKQMVEMGWSGIAVAEEWGGLNFGMRGMGILMEASGRTLTASPLLSVAVAAHVLEKYGSDEQKSLLQTICSEGKVVTCAVQEGAFYNPTQSTTTALSQNGQYAISGTKDMVVDGSIADVFLVSANIEDGVGIFLVDAKSEGVSLEQEFMMDSRYYSKVRLDKVIVEANALVGQSESGKKIVRDITNIANALLSAEMVGMMSEAFDRTMAYLKERRQFDKVIGSFQGLQHRAADLYTEIELCRSLTIKTLDAIDEDNFMAPALCSMSKVKCSAITRLASNEGIQMFGGIGMTDDEEIGFFLKRARVAIQLFGDRAYHLDRYARMSGY